MHPTGFLAPGKARPAARRARFAAVLALLVAGTHLHATSTWERDAAFAPEFVEEVDALAGAQLRTAPEGGLVAWGFFSHVDGAPMARIARLGPSGRRVAGFASPFGEETTVLAAEAVTEGRTLVLARRFTTTGGVASSDVRVLRLRADGAVDPAFAPIAVAGAGEFVRAAGGRIVLVGDFSLLAQPSLAGLARFSPAGELEATWAPRLDGRRLQAFAAAAASDGTVWAIVRPLDGPEATATRRARFDAVTGDGVPVEDGTPPRTEERLALAADGALLVANHGPEVIDFVSTPEGGIRLVLRRGIARYRPDGVRDPGFAMLIPDAVSCRAILGLPDGRIVVEMELAEAESQGGASVFVLTAGGAAVFDVRSLLAAPRIVELVGADGTGAVLVREASRVGSRPGVAPTGAEAVESVFPILVGRRPARVDLGAGTLRPVPLALALRRAGAPLSLRRDPAGGVLVAGAFTEVDGTPRAGLARFRADRTLDMEFTPVVFPGAAPEPVLATSDGGWIVRRDHDRESANSAVTTRVIEFRKLRSDGSLEPGFAADARLATPTAETKWLLEGPDGRLLVSHLADPGLAPRLAWTDASGTIVEELPARFTAATIGAGQDPLASAVRLADGRLVIAGAFTGVDGLERRTVARLGADGRVDPTHRAEIDEVLAAPEVRLLADGAAVIEHRRSGLPDVFRLLPDGSRDPGFPAVTRFPRDPATGLPDGNLPERVVLPGPATAFVIERLRAHDGSLWTLTQVAGAETRIVRFTPADVPSITLEPRSLSVIAGAAGWLYVETGTSKEAAIQWFRDGVPVPGATTKVLGFDSAQVSEGGVYHATVTLGATTLVSAPAQLEVRPNTARVVNFSARAQVSDGRGLLAGFVVDEAGASPVVVRAVGLGLLPYLPTQLLVDPVLRLYAGRTPLGDDRGSALNGPAAGLAASYGAFPVRMSPLFPIGANIGCALARPLEVGPHLLEVTSGDGRAGTVLAEGYAGGDDPARIVNVSVRARTQPGGRPAVLGLVVGGAGPLRVLVRAVGPGLAEFGVSGFETDPRLELRSQNGAWTTFANDDWHATPRLLEATTRAGAFPLAPGSADAAVLVTIQPGSHTLEVGGGPVGGEVLLELYLPDA